MRESSVSPRYYFDANPVAGKLADGFRLALFLDFDGTLVPIRKTPGLPYLPSAVQELLQSIVRSGKSAVTIISGRSLADLKKRAFVQGAYYAGSHGLQISGRGIRFVHAKARLTRSAIITLADELAAEITGHQGIVIEKKPYSFALHYRAAGRAALPFLRRLVRGKMSADPSYRRYLTVESGKKVMEVLPRVSWKKGAAALHVMKRLADGYVPLCLGDDVTDESLFEAFREKGITVRVGPSRRTAAIYYLKHQQEVLFLMQQIQKLLTRSSPGE